MKLHNHAAVSASCHMIAVMTDVVLIHRQVCVVDHSRTTMLVQFIEAISYRTGKLGLECFEQIVNQG